LDLKRRNVKKRSNKTVDVYSKCSEGIRHKPLIYYLAKITRACSQICICSAVHSSSHRKL